MQITVRTVERGAGWTKGPRSGLKGARKNSVLILINQRRELTTHCDSSLSA